MVKKVRKSAKKVSKHKEHKPETHVEVYCYKKEFGKAPEENAFVLHDDRKLRTVYELIDELETMPDDVFHEYVTWERNDFANWINDVFEAPDLATEIRKMQNRFDGQSLSFHEKRTYPSRQKRGRFFKDRRPHRQH